jgi:thioredoxin reductase (NADPH)
MNPVLIVGAGPAGMAAALELNRRGIGFRLVERHRVGGLALNAGWIRNYPGFPGGIEGRRLMGHFEAHLMEAGIEVAAGEIRAIERGHGDVGVGFRVKAGLRVRAEQSDLMEGIVFSAAILATGTVPVRAGFEGEPALRAGGRLFYDVVDRLARRGCGTGDFNRWAVIGGGDVAFDYGISLAERGADVTLLCRSAPRAIGFLRGRAGELGLSVRAEEEIVSGVLSEDGVRLALASGEAVRADAVMVAVGREADRTLFGAGEEIEVRPSGETTRDGLFLAGDVLHPELKQVGVAVGDGIRAAARAAEFIWSMKT